VTVSNSDQKDKNREKRDTKSRGREAGERKNDRKGREGEGMESGDLIIYFIGLTRQSIGDIVYRKKYT